MHLWKMVVAAALAAGLLGCATAAPNTPSGRPEVTLKATPPAAVKSFIADAMKKERLSKEIGSLLKAKYVLCARSAKAVGFP